ncbi:MAG: hypothetical protein Q8R02_14985 [Hyphomonadaceae bacterium]|nr:hypothetical protein [Hyphomonadaceae bacterium]
MTDLNEENPAWLRFTRFWESFASAFAHPFEANGALSQFVTNPDVTGAYAEAWVRWAARSMLPAFRVSTGAIILTSDATHEADLTSVPQLDLIIWDPTELPALFEQGEFAVVHQHAARAIIEVKRSLPDKEKAVAQLQRQRMRLSSELRANALGVVVQHYAPLFKGRMSPGWPGDSARPPEPAFTRLLDSGTHKPDAKGIFAFIYFLSHVAKAQGPRTAA